MITLLALAVVLAFVLLALLALAGLSGYQLPHQQEPPAPPPLEPPPPEPPLPGQPGYSGPVSVLDRLLGRGVPRDYEVLVYRDHTYSIIEERARYQTIDALKDRILQLGRSGNAFVVLFSATELQRQVEVLRARLPERT